ncbi:MAG: GlsB/YeaQ/YmgE family stress response membrane protein [Pirellulales bacterium]|nr:GlsB/YeaQ/YmgE family stress response membrane protein [Pirellulales bacterium]
MQLSLGELIVWLIVGALVGNVVGRVVTLKKEGLGRWTNLAVGMGGALVGGFLFNLFGIDFGLGDLKVSFEDLIAATAGALLLLVVWKLVHWFRRGKHAQNA